MNPTKQHSRFAPPRALLASALIAGLGSSVLGQTATQTASGAAPSSGNSDEVIQLNPFDVTADRDDSYGALNSNSVTRFNVQLSKLPVSADIFTGAFMKDIGATDIESMVQGYSAGSGLEAVDGANVGAQPGDHVAHNYTEIRGFNTSAMQRDSLMPVGPMFNPGSTAPGITSNFDVERVEVVMGPQALLYSGGGPGGVINVVSKMAQFGAGTHGSLEFAVDQYGSKDSQLDLSQGSDRIAVRIALLDNDDQTQRVNIGDTVTGGYGQLALKLFKNTTVRLNLEQTNEHAFLGDPTMALTSAPGGTDSRAGDNLSYLLATNQTGATVNPATGLPNSAGALLGGQLNWGNLASLGGWLAYENTKTTTEDINIQTSWTQNVSSEFALGYSASDYAFRAGPATLYTPANTSNTTGQWATGISPSETDEPAHTKGVRFSIVDQADLFGGKAQAQTIVGADFVGSKAYSIAYSYWQADSNFNPIYVAPSINSIGQTGNSDGRTKLPTTYYSIANGIVEYPYFPLGATKVTINGVNYVRMPTNQTNPTLITAANPLGLTSSSGLNEYNIVDNKGYFIENMTQWLDKKLTTLAGVRANDGFDSLLYVPTLPYRVATSKSIDYDLGANYQLLSWLAPYVSASNVTTLPSGMFPDPYGNMPQAGKGVGEEAGFKFQTKDDSVSGSLAFYHSHGTNQLFSNTVIEAAIAPAGLNGTPGNASSYFPLDHTTDGVELNFTANPVKNWRMRFDASYQDGRLSNSASYAPLYDDQFYANSAGQVTYQDGTLVYVNANAFSSKTPVVTSTSAGATPLTIAMMNNPSSLYYAFPVVPTGAILSSSAVATVLKSTDPVHGTILTGNTGLPISDIQITPPWGTPVPIVAYAKGDRTLGSPKIHIVYTNLYTFDHGWLKGLELGGSVNMSYQNVGFYYLANGAFGTSSAATTRLPFYTPNSTTLDGIFGYSHKFGSFTWETRLNIQNMFNHYDVIVIPSQTSGYTTATALTGAYFGLPRSYTLTNTISF